MTGGFPLDLLLFGMIAAFLVLRLRGILGRRTGFERPPQGENGGPVAVPGLARNAQPEPAAAAEARPLPLPGTPQAVTLERMRGIDRAFDPAHFLRGAEAAFRMIVDAFARGDRAALRPLLSDDTYRSFEQVIATREAAGQTQRSEVRSVEHASIETATLEDSIATITVRFVSDQVAETVGADGKPVAGADAVAELTDLWSFERDLRNPDPAWRWQPPAPADHMPSPDHQVLHGDCLDVLAGMAPELIDVVVTSPPYNLGIAYASYGDRKEEAEYLDWMVRVAAALRRVLRPDGSFFLNVAGSSTQPWLPFELIVRLRPFFSLQNHIAWVKSIAVNDDGVGHFKPVPGERFLHRNHEHIFHLTHDGAVRLDRLAIGVPFKDKSNIARRGHAQDRRCRGDTWFIPYRTVQSRQQKFCHPGTFPLDLPRWCIRLHGKPGALVLDPFAGAGTTVVAAALEDCRGIGIEIDAEDVATARARLAQLDRAA